MVAEPDYVRGGDGHASESPASEPPRVSPLPAQDRGTVRPLEMPGVPPPVAHVALPANAVAAEVPQAITTRLSMGSPSDR